MRRLGKRDGITCPNCGSSNFNFNGWEIRKGYKIRRALCKNCGTRFMTNIKEPLPGYRTAYGNQVKKGESIYEI